MSEMLTPGQIRVREIVSEYLPEYRRLNKERKAADWGSNYHEIYHKRISEIGKEISKRFASDRTIKKDLITGRHISKCAISRNYLDWLRMTGEERTIERDFPKVKLDKFILDAGAYSDHFAYSGGAKSYTTFSVLLALANSETITENIDWDSVYYDDEGILTLGNGGCHRQLAHILFGQTKMNPSWMVIYENSLVYKELHNSLLTMEKMAEDCERYFAWETKLYESQSIEKMKKEAETIIKFFSDTSFAEQEAIKASIVENIEWPPKVLTIKNLIERRNDIQSVKEMSKLEVWIIRAKKRMGIKISYMSPMKCWLLGLTN